MSIALLIEQDEDKAARMAKVKDTYENWLTANLAWHAAFDEPAPSER